MHFSLLGTRIIFLIAVLRNQHVTVAPQPVADHQWNLKLYRFQVFQTFNGNLSSLSCRCYISGTATIDCTHMETLTQWMEPIILWVSIGMPSTGNGKSSLFNYLLGLLHVRKRCNRKDRCSPLIDSRGVIFEEAHSKQIWGLMKLYDELSSFLTQISLYGKKGVSDSHDTSTLLMFYI